jgi:hypothetical protein
MLKRKITINKKAKDWKDRYPLVEVKWLDICSDSSWQGLKQLQEAKLPTCVTRIDPSCRATMKSGACAVKPESRSTSQVPRTLDY